jgi:hypothetical protein
MRVPPRRGATNVSKFQEVGTQRDSRKFTRMLSGDVQKRAKTVCFLKLFNALTNKSKAPMAEFYLKPIDSFCPQIVKS